MPKWDHGVETSALLKCRYSYDFTHSLASLPEKEVDAWKALRNRVSAKWQEETELGKLLSKLLFQLMLMSDSLNDMVRLVDESHGAQVSRSTSRIF
ncbi:unnamed protein product [Cylicostephanus goldi]|uniref:Uncharacterized protein n=1 Tax=Cylicostephanus goldi TaxID=71465 RepID=A0A3P6SSL6_CYLGO|nr:unnamed protein product [Cylicostephanus goldi]